MDPPGKWVQAPLDRCKQAHPPRYSFLNKTMKKNTALNLRVIPTQKRARDKIELILDTTAQLLEEIGSDAVTTKLIAERAAIRVRNVYRYFPNKQAILYALAQRMAERQAVLLGDFALIADPDVDFDKALEVTVDAFQEATLAEPGIIAIRKAMQSSLELQALDEQLDRDLARKLAKAISKRGTSLVEQDLELICTIILNISTALGDRSLREFAESHDYDKAIKIVDELKRILKAYLAPFIKTASSR
jgi:AcrR family transcriptional regulator